MPVGIIYSDPGELASAAGLTLETYALARMIASEIGSGSSEELRACGECARNRAARWNTDVADLLLTSRGKNYSSEADGLFSQQYLGKWASTYRDASKSTIAAARDVMNGSNYTDGAVDFFDPKSQIIGDPQGGGVIKTSVEQYIKNNANDGLEWIGVRAGINARRLMLFAPASNASPYAALTYLSVGGEDSNLENVTNESASILDEILDWFRSLFADFGVR